MADLIAAAHGRWRREVGLDVLLVVHVLQMCCDLLLGVIDRDMDCRREWGDTGDGEATRELKALSIGGASS